MVESSPSAAMSVCTLSGDSGRYRLAGPMNALTAKRVLASGLGILAPEATVVIDLSAVTVADSAGLAVLLVWLGKARDRRCVLTFQGLPEQLLAIARVCGVAAALPIGAG